VHAAAAEARLVVDPALVDVDVRAEDLSGPSRSSAAIRAIAFEILCTSKMERTSFEDFSTMQRSSWRTVGVGG
jgi:hypothetical protein